MNIQARKLSLIEEFLRITDVKLIHKLELLIKQETTKTEMNDVTPMSSSQFYEMIDQAKSDYDAGRVISHQDLKKDIETWS